MATPPQVSSTSSPEAATTMISPAQTALLKRPPVFSVGMFSPQVFSQPEFFAFWILVRARFSGLYRYFILRRFYGLSASLTKSLWHTNLLSHLSFHFSVL
jgi:hypothetical protein